MGDRRGAEGAEVGPDGGGAGIRGRPACVPTVGGEFRGLNIGGLIDPPPSSISDLPSPGAPPKNRVYKMLCLAREGGHKMYILGPNSNPNPLMPMGFGWHKKDTCHPLKIRKAVVNF